MKATKMLKKIVEISQQMESFEASASQKNTGAGSRREGEQFENLISQWWKQLCAIFVSKNIQRTYITKGKKVLIRYKHKHNRRSIFIPIQDEQSLAGISEDSVFFPDAWFANDFLVSDMIENFPGREDAITKYSPKTGQFREDNYFSMFEGMKTKFDGTIVMEEEGVLRNKILLEYKTGKSSLGNSIDGNAHERLSFQIMQYLEIATKYTKCSLVIMANGAFAFYKNKYHPCFHVQSDRLSNFCWFDMSYLCTKSEYLSFAEKLLQWLFGTEERVFS